MGTATIGGIPIPVTLMYSIGSLTFDAWLAEAHTSELQVTENPVERGSVISDHCFMKPRQVVISAAVSDIKMPSAAAGYDDSAAGRSHRAFALLTQIQQNFAAGQQTLLTVATGLKIYSNMICTSIVARRDAETAQLLAFDATLVELITVSTQAVSYTAPSPKPGKPTHQAAASKDKGKEQPQPEDDVGILQGLIDNAKKLTQAAKPMLKF